MTTGVTQQILASQLELADLLRAGRDRMWEPQELPGRYGRVVRRGPPSGSRSMARQWWQGAGRFGAMVTWVRDAGRGHRGSRRPGRCIDSRASVGGFEVPPRGVDVAQLRHKESDIRVDLLPGGQHPAVHQGRPPRRSRIRPAWGPGRALRYIDLPGLVELKLAAGRVRDESDVVELILANPDQIDAIRQRLGAAHA